MRIYRKKRLQPCTMVAWIVVTGIASLMSAGIITPTEEQIIKVIEETITGDLDRTDIFIFNNNESATIFSDGLQIFS